MIKRLVDLFKTKGKNKMHGNHDLILHFSYHKCMTSYFNSIFHYLGEKWNWNFRHHNSDYESFHKTLAGYSNNSIYSLNNVDPKLSLIKVDYRGTHVVRDPRDLVVSGYRYHKWCQEKWTLVPMNTNFREQIKLKQLGLGACSELSYQELLNRVDEETGYLLEYNWRKPMFGQMLNWNFHNPKILELKYEDILGKEEYVFFDIFKFYGFDERMIRFAMKFTMEKSFRNKKANKKTGDNRHAAVGAIAQWKEFMPNSVLSLFNDENQKLLWKLKYER